ncbi:MAG: hypothetical protein RPU15_17240 [Candidatus Sedimenticola sp. (ex Thyasira tokunagai)]
MNKSFLLKLRQLSVDRDITPWLKSMGFSAGLVGKVLGGQEPGGDLLRALMRHDRVSMQWLEEGRGAPYMVSLALDDTDAIKMLEALFDEEWSVVIATDHYQDFSVVLHMPGQHGLKVKGKSEPKMVGYRIVEVVAGNIGLKTVRWLDEQDKANWVLPLTSVDMNRLATGRMGNLELFGYADGRKQSKGLINGKQKERLIDKMKSSLHDSPLRERLEHNGELMCEEEGAAYASVTKTEEMVRRFEQLPADQQDLVLDLMQAMVEKKQ